MGIDLGSAFLFVVFVLCPLALGWWLGYGSAAQHSPIADAFFVALTAGTSAFCWVWFYRINTEMRTNKALEGPEFFGLVELSLISALFGLLGAGLTAGIVHSIVKQRRVTLRQRKSHGP